MRRWIKLICLAWLLGSSGALAQSSCGFFDPKLTFADGSKACLSEFAFFSRKGLITSPEYADHLAVAKANSSSYAIATSATPERCPFVQFTAWNWAGYDAQEALPKCNQRMQEVLKKSPDFANCRCETLIDSGVTKLSRSDLTKRLGSFEHYLLTGMTQDQTRQAERRKAEEELAKAKRNEEELAKRKEEELAKAKQKAEAERIAKEKREAQEKEIIEQAKRDEERRRKQAEVPPIVAAPTPATKPSVQSKPQSIPIPGPSIYADRVALVVGNKNYLKDPLDNPINDARAMQTRLKALGFRVIYFEDMRVSQIGDAMEQVANSIRPGAAFVFFYAGHGTQVDGENMFPAVDAKLTSAFQLPTQSLDLNRVIRIVESKKSAIRVLILDACRNNPWQQISQRKDRSVAAGLAKIDPAEGTIILHATRAGSVASDASAGNHGLFTFHLLRHLDTPQLPVEQLFKRVASDVRQASNGSQIPWIEGQIEGEFTFKEK